MELSKRTDLIQLDYLLQEIKELQLHCQDLMDENRALLNNFDDMRLNCKIKMMRFDRNYLRRKCLAVHPKMWQNKRAAH
jgi:hypothetical protein